MQDRRSSVSESVLVEVFFVGKAVFRNAGALRTAFPRRSVGTIIKFFIHREGTKNTKFMFTCGCSFPSFSLGMLLGKLQLPETQKAGALIVPTLRRGNAG